MSTFYFAAMAVIVPLVMVVVVVMPMLERIGTALQTLPL